MHSRENCPSDGKDSYFLTWGGAFNGLCGKLQTANLARPTTRMRSAGQHLISVTSVHGGAVAYFYPMVLAYGEKNLACNGGIFSGIKKGIEEKKTNFTLCQNFSLKSCSIPRLLVYFLGGF